MTGDRPPCGSCKAGRHWECDGTTIDTSDGGEAHCPCDLEEHGFYQ